MAESGEPTKRKRSDSECSISSTSSPEDSSDSESSSSSSEERHSKRAKSSKKKGKHKSKKHSKHKSKKDKKKKKKKKKKEKKNSTKERIEQSKKGSSTALFGMHGYVGEADFYNKQLEFHVYVREVMDEEPTMLGKREEKEAWKTYCEDYNTATFPSEKYYDLEKWEKNERLKAFKRKQKEDMDPDKVRSEFNDEEARRQENRREDERAKHMRTAAELAQMDSTKVADMKRQDQLKREMQLHLQTGNRSEAEKIRKLISKDIDMGFGHVERLNFDLGGD